jgi:Tol biopolymer transport system component
MRHLLIVCALLAPPIAFAQVAPLRLAIVDRAGTVTPLGTLPGWTSAPRISPDGRRLVYDGDGSLWIAELARLDTPRRLGAGAHPLWSGDGSMVFFILPINGKERMLSMPAGGGEARVVIEEARAPESWSDAAQMLSYITLSGTNYDVRGYSLRDTSLVPVAVQPVSEMGSRFSPDGRWVAYESFEHGTPEIYVEPWPRTGGRTRVTIGGGRRAAWSADGRELFFDRDDRQIHSVRVQSTSPLAFGEPAALPIKGFIQGGARRQWELLPDGKLLLMFRP